MVEHASVPKHRNVRGGNGKAPNSMLSLESSELLGAQEARDLVIALGDVVLPEKIACTQITVHHWKIPSPEGPTSIGLCAHCGASREFRNSLDSSRWEREQHFGGDEVRTNGSSDRNLLLGLRIRGFENNE